MTIRNSVSEAHEIFAKYHRDLQVDDEGKPLPQNTFPQFHRVQKTGVIYATSRAAAHGFTSLASEEGDDWANMGQGAPETGHLEGAPPRNFDLKMNMEDLEYAPVNGLSELREKVADYYNHLYRQGKSSQYTQENVCIVPGGRAGITRIMAALGHSSLGYFTPDYTAYEQQLGMFLRVSPVPLLHRNVSEALMTSEEFEFQCRGAGLGGMLLSNPANPTGQSIEGEQLKDYVRVARERECAIIMDEFYSHFYYDGVDDDGKQGIDNYPEGWPKTVSSAAYIDDVDEDPILIVNGLTKNWRCPGFRVCWIVAPKKIVSMLAAAGSFLDGGANAPLQRLALPLMDLEFIRQDAWALQRHFRKKRDYLLTKLEELGISVDWKPTSTFYVWASIKNLPSPLNDCLVFLEECVKYKVVCVPGVFFDLNPRGIRNIKSSSCISHIRLSYGPRMENLVKGVEQMAKMIDYWEKNPERVSLYARESDSL